MFKKIMNFTNKKISEREYKKFIMSPDCPNEIREVIVKILIPHNIHVAAFLDNLLWIESEGKHKNSNVTKSVYRIYNPLGWPIGYPNWFLAGFPDVAEWYSSVRRQASNGDTVSIYLLSFIRDFKEIDESIMYNAGGSITIEYADMIVTGYKKSTGNRLECCVIL